MSYLVFKAVNRETAKKIVDFWNPYCKTLNEFSGNGEYYVVTYTRRYSTFCIENYQCGVTYPRDARVFDYIPTFMELPKVIRDKMIERSEYKSPIPFILDIYTGEDNGGFDWSRSPEGHEFWKAILEDLKFDLFYKHFNINQDESRLSEQESPLRRGSSRDSSGIRCRVHKARVTIQPLGYQKVIGRG